MTVIETRPETEAPPIGNAVPPKTLDALVGSSDHKTIGRTWIAGGLVLLTAATVISGLAGFEASDLGGFALVEDGDQFAQLWSLGRVLFLFGGVLPILVGLGTFLVPLQIGAPALAFARGASGAVWTWMVGIGLLIGSYVLNGGPGGGQGDFVVLWATSLGVVALALMWAMTILATTILGARTRGMSLDRVPATTWSFFVFSLFGLLALPLLIAELVIVYVQVRHGFLPLGSRLGLTGVVDSLSLAPTIYWLGIPVLGIAADVIGTHTSRPVRAHRAVLASIGMLGITAFASEFFSFASSRTADFNNELLIIGVAASILPILGVLGLVGDSLRQGTLRMTTALLGSLIAGLVLLLASVTSLLAQAAPVAVFIDEDTPVSFDLDRVLVLNGTTFHDGIRGMVLAATMVAIISALHHWAPKLWGRRLSEPLGLLGVASAAAGGVLWGLGSILAGIDDQAAYPVADLVGGENVEFFNLIAAVGMVLVVVAAVTVTVNALGTALAKGSGKGPDRWTGATLEWATASPPAFGNFERAPVVRSALPLIDGKSDTGCGPAPGDDATAADDDATTDLESSR